MAIFNKINIMNTTIVIIFVTGMDFPGFVPSPIGKEYPEVEMYNIYRLEK